MDDETSQSKPMGGEGAEGRTTTTTTRGHRTIFKDGSRKYMTAVEAEVEVDKGTSVVEGEILKEDHVTEDKEQNKKNDTTEVVDEGVTTPTTTLSSSNDIVKKSLSQSSNLGKPLPVKKQRPSIVKMFLALIVIIVAIITAWSIAFVGEYSMPSTTTIGTTDMHYYNTNYFSFKTLLEGYTRVLGYDSVLAWITQKLPPQLQQKLQQQNNNDDVDNREYVEEDAEYHIEDEEIIDFDLIDTTTTM